MTQFDDRERAEEARFAHSEELRFRAEVRRDKLLAFWAAELMGLTELDGRQAYAEEVVRADFTEKGDEDVFRKVADDLRAKGVTITDEAIRLKMAELVPIAREQVLKEADS
jgi:hypothetical protein